MTRFLGYVRIISECVVVVSISVAAIAASCKCLPCFIPTRSSGECWLGATKLGSSVADFKWDNGQAWTYTSETDSGEQMKKIIQIILVLCLVRPTIKFHYHLII